VKKLQFSSQSYHPCISCPNTIVTSDHVLGSREPAFPSPQKGLSDRGCVGTSSVWVKLRTRTSLHYFKISILAFLGHGKTSFETLTSVFVCVWFIKYSVLLLNHASRGNWDLTTKSLSPGPSPFPTLTYEAHKEVYFSCRRQDHIDFCMSQL
jgi:hypothetical protein